MDRFITYLIVLNLAWLLATSAGCSKDAMTPDPEPEFRIIRQEVVLNPQKIAPLTAEINFTLSAPVTVEIRITGKHGADSDVVHQTGHLSTLHAVPVLGLYPNHTNTVKVTLRDASGHVVASDVHTITTIPLLNDLPEVRIDVPPSGVIVEGMTLVSYFGHDGEVTPQRPFMFDKYGDIRWYLDFRSNPELAHCFYDVGIERLQNGNLYFGNTSTARIYEMTMTGQILNQWEMPGFSFHHNVQEMPNGNFLATVNKHGIGTVEDHILEIDRISKQIINVWDLRESLDSQRRTMSTDGFDWIHVNSVDYDQSDNTIVVSGRTQAVVKLNQENEVVWILSPHKGWQTAGNGADLSNLLLQPLDASGQPITDAAVLRGDAGHPEFEWCWYQHAASVLPNGNVMLFDNGFRRHFAFDERYSRAVEYEIDQANMTVRQVWSYGKERGEETFARIVSDVDFHPANDRVIFSPGALVFNGAHSGKVVELSYSNQQVIFEASILPPQPAWDITFHRTERLKLYSD